MFARNRLIDFSISLDHLLNAASKDACTLSQQAAFNLIEGGLHSDYVLKECFLGWDLPIPGHYRYDPPKKMLLKMQILQGLAFLCMEIR